MSSSRRSLNLFFGNILKVNHMETVTSFFQHRVPGDWLVIIVTVVCVPLGILLIMSWRPPIRPFLVIALLPLLLGLFVTYLKYREVDRLLLVNATMGRRAYEAGRREARVTAYIGGSGTALILVIGLIGLARQKGHGS